VNKKPDTEEWLYEISSKKSDEIFSRKDGKIKLGKSLKNRSIKNRFEIYAEDMKNQTHQLFLSEIARKKLNNDNVQIINKLYEWFENKLIIIYPHTKFNPVSLIVSDTKLIGEFKRYLKNFDTGIRDIITVEEKDLKKALKDVPNNIVSDIENDLNKKDKLNILLTAPEGSFIINKDKDGEIIIKKLGTYTHRKD